MDTKWIAISLLLLCACSRQEQPAAPRIEPPESGEAASTGAGKSAPVDAPAADKARPLPEADITAVVTCTGATLKMGDVELWKKWVAESQRRFATIYPDKSAQEIEAYTLERALDKRRALERTGVGTQRAFTDYFNKNCLGVIQ